MADPIESAPLSDSLRALARRGVVKPVRKGAQLIAEGDLGDTIYIVLTGRLRTYSADMQGHEVTYGVYGPGEYVGEMSLDGGPRSANVECLTSGSVVLIARPTLEAHLRAYPDFAFDLLAKVIRRARTVTLTLKQIALNDVYGRLKTLLEDLAPPAVDGQERRIEPAPSHKEMGAMLACSPSMVTKVLQDLERGGVVKVGRRYLVIRRALPAKW